MAGLITAELVRAWESYFRQKGGVSPRVVAEVVPVVVMDDNSTGPYPAYRMWHAGSVLAVGINSQAIVAIVNNDPITTRSAVVVDRIVLGMRGSIDPAQGIAWFIGILRVSDKSLSFAPARDSAGEKDPTSAQTFDQPFGNVQFASGSAAAGPALVSTPYPAAAIDVPQVIEGRFILGPQQQLICSYSVGGIAGGIVPFFRGRYYAAL